MADNLWPEGERVARESAVEVVGLGFQLRSAATPPDPFAAFAPGLLFAPLANEALQTIDEFYVSGSQLTGVLYQLQAHYGEGNVVPVCLWHSHLRTQNPSVFDTANFPEWLVHYGAVYHIPTNSTRLYNRFGVIEDESSIPEPIALR